MINLNYHAPTTLEKVLFPLLYTTDTRFSMIKIPFRTKYKHIKCRLRYIMMIMCTYNKCKIVNHTINFKTNVVLLLSSLHTT